MKTMKKNIACLLFILIAAGAFGQADGPEARGCFDRGLEAVGRATTRQELKAAVQVIEKAKRLAPQWAEVHFALGRVYEALDIYDRAA